MGRISAREKERRRKISLFRKGKPRLKAVCKKISQTLMGHSLSTVTKKKISKTLKKKGIIPPSRKGMAMPECARKKMQKTHAGINTGPKNHSWKGGITPLADDIRRSRKSDEWREKIFRRDNWTCQECNVRGGILHPHHLERFYKILKRFLLKYNNLDPVKDKYKLYRLSLTYKPFWDIRKGKTLCEKCHRKKHSVKEA